MASLLVSHHRPGFYFRVLEEGEVGAGDRIEKVATGPERVSVADIDALLYLPSPSHEELERSLRIPALSPGWKGSLQAILNRKASETGNPGLTTSTGPPPAWVGFRPLRVTKVDRECSNVVSFSFEQPDGSALPAALPGQFLVLRLRVAADLPPLLRNYSISSVPGGKAYRVSVKREAHGRVSSFLHDHVGVGDVLEVSAPRGTFTLQAGDGPVVMLSAGIGATPVLAMLHYLAENNSPREIWWLHGARNRALHPFATEVRDSMKGLGRAKSHIVYSQPEPADQVGLDYDSTGHLDMDLLDRLGVPRSADFYLCGPPAFLRSFTAGLKQWGAQPSRVRAEIFGKEEPLTPGIASVRQPVHLPSGTPGSGPQVSFTRSGLTVPWNSRFLSLLELAEACDVPVKWSCRTGVCHTCESALIGGTVHYQPAPLEPPAEGNLLICCSQPTSDIEIDL
jgi:ferredoxin-NADP reductase/ferredoxin